MSLILDAIYSAVILLGSPWLLYRRWIVGKPVAGWKRKLSGAVGTRQSDRPCVWFHAVSVGEVLQLKTLIQEFQQRHPLHEVVISTTTGTGYDVAKEKFSKCQVIYWPFDFSWAVSRSLNAIRPVLVVLVELEVWPNFLSAAKSRQIPVVVVNGRISPRSFSTYRRFRHFLRSTFGRLTSVAVQSEEYGQRFLELGVAAERIRVTGNLKFDRVEACRNRPEIVGLRRFFGLNDTDLVLIAGSTQEGEEAAALASYRTLREEFPELRIVLVPRHRERFEDVALLVEREGFPLCRRSRSPAEPGIRPVLLLDTLGELADCWGLADLAFVGGSLTPRGGQNMLEPAGYGAAILFGPHTHNFRDIVQELLSREAAHVVTQAAELTSILRSLLRDHTRRMRMGQAAQDFVMTQQGATLRTLELLDQYLPEHAKSRAA